MISEKDLYKLKRGDKVLVECTVEAVFVHGGMVMVSTRDCNEGFDAYMDEVIIPATEEEKNCEICINNSVVGCPVKELMISKCCESYKPKQTTTKQEKSCKNCKYQKFREAYSCVETPCDVCYEGSCFETKEFETKEGDRE